MTLSPFDTWILACETRDGVLVRDPDSGDELNGYVRTITPDAAEQAVKTALARYHLSEPTMPWVLRVEAARLLGEPEPERPTGAEADRQGLL